ncbi:MAG TPA: T9SS type A sorting domain-containing protein, partial [Bacteroidia bacterium]|nr:T9SS type A sorting domain-containing protein [Bacteroidia bacterium]
MIRFINFNKLTIRLCLIVNLFFSFNSFSQGLNHTWLLGYHYNISNPTDTMERMDFSFTNYNLYPQIRKMPFSSTQGNISDINGSFLMSSNGIWIANSIGDTMPNGTGLNPGFAATNMKSYGLSVINGNIILPMPDDSNRFVLFHQTIGDFTNYSTDIFYTTIDKTLDGGKGDVVNKNNIAQSGAFGYGLAACKHGNGRDWWIIALNNTANVIHKFLLTPNVVQYIGSQNLSVPVYGDWAGQPVFSPDGNKFAYRNAQYISPIWFEDFRLFDFDRCNGLFTLDTIIDYSDTFIGFATAFSPNSKYLYVASSQYIYQYNTDTTNIAASVQIVAVNDSFQSTGQTTTDFFQMYLAANGKIYVTSGSSVLHLHEMDYPDSSGISCNVNLHNISLNCLNFRSTPVHPNYYLGCDTTQTTCPCLTTGINEINQHDFKFSVTPNPSNGSFKIIYLLPQNKSGTLQIFDINGKQVYKQNLPPWSTMQYISLPKLANGVYNCTITSNNERVHKKL